MAYDFYVTTAPTGLTATRNGATFTFTWKIGDKDYGRGQDIDYGIYTVESGTYWYSPNSDFFVAADRWVDTSEYGTGMHIGGNITTKTVTIDLTKFYPYTNIHFKSIVFWVRGMRADFTENDYTYRGSGSYPTLMPSNYSKIEWTAQAPNNPKSVTASFMDYNRTVFKWEMNADAAMNQWVVKYEWEAILLRNSEITDGSKVWFNSQDSTYLSGNGTSFAAGEYSCVEDTTHSGWRTTDSYTRWFRFRVRGVRGDSAWFYAKHVYAMPRKASNLSGTVTIEQTTSLIYLQWVLDTTASHPVDEVIVQYCIGVPRNVTENEITPPTDGWTDSPVGEIKDTSGTDGVTFRIEGRPDLGECVWARVRSAHGANNIFDTNYSQTCLLDTERLNSPENLTVAVDSTTHMASVSATPSATNDWNNSIVVIKYFDRLSYPTGFDIAYIPHGDTSVTFQCPDWGEHSIYFQAYTASPRYILTNTKPGEIGVNVLTVFPHAYSDMVTQSGEIPSMPTNVSLSKTDIKGTINVKWAWSSVLWEYLEISWADHEDAWESTNGPSTYTLNRIQAPSWNISGLSTDSIWYVRLRFGDVPNSGGNETIWGAYTDIRSIDLSSSPEPPVLHLSAGVTTVDGNVKASWTYFSEDGTSQQFADIYLYENQNDNPSYTRLYHLTTAQSQTISPTAIGWSTGDSHQLVLRVTSEGGKISDFSQPVTLVVAEPPVIEIESDSLVRDVEVIADKEKGETRTITALTEMPLSVHVVGAGYDGTTGVSITRLNNYHLIRPDENEFTGFSGESVAVVSQIGEDEIVIKREDLIGYMDDGAQYRLTATISDRYGQTASTFIDFEVCWDHQAIIPSASVTIDESYEVAFLTPRAPQGADSTDTCDIYRLSADKPELVYEAATFGHRYVDMYPTIGENGGYRFVFKTANGDYITEDRKMAWLDIQTNYRRLDQIINFGNYAVSLTYNVDLSSNWSKDFKETKYLGGSIQGDWNAAVSRTSSMSGVVVTADDQDIIKNMRRLAVYPGLCRIRSGDGSNYEADVQVSESRGHEALDLVTNFSLNITRVDTETPVGLTYEEWASFIEDISKRVTAFCTSPNGTKSYTLTYNVKRTTSSGGVARVTFSALYVSTSVDVEGITATAISIIDVDTGQTKATINPSHIPSGGMYSQMPSIVTINYPRSTESSEDHVLAFKVDFTVGQEAYSDTKYIYINVPILEEE